MRSYGKFYSQKAQLDQQQFQSQVCQYLNHKKFDLEAVDLMPFILATLLSVNIVIVQRRGGNILVSPFQELVKHKKRFSSVYILKTRDHFDGLCKLSSIFPIPPIHFQTTVVDQT